MTPDRSFLLLILLSIWKPVILFSQSGTLLDESGNVSFFSEAPLEIISAKSAQLKGAIDKANNTFAFAVDIRSFQGFNSDLQREHFHENYMQTEKIPTASFSGKFIDYVDFNVNGTYSVRARGMFSIHGIQKERIIKGIIVVTNKIVNMNAVFNLRLEDYDIKVPKIVYEKIAEEVRVEINIRFKK